MVHTSYPISKLVLILGAVAGMTMIVITPPFQVPDEGAHFFRAYQTSTGNLKLENRGGLIGAELPRSLLETRKLFDNIRTDKRLLSTAATPCFAGRYCPIPPRLTPRSRLEY
jgi:hypothetical protein